MTSGVDGKGSERENWGSRSQSQAALRVHPIDRWLKINDNLPILEGPYRKRTLFIQTHYFKANGQPDGTYRFILLLECLTVIVCPRRCKQKLVLAL